MMIIDYERGEAALISETNFKYRTKSSKRYLLLFGQNPLDTCSIEGQRTV